MGIKENLAKSYLDKLTTEELVAFIEGKVGKTLSAEVRRIAQDSMGGDLAALLAAYLRTDEFKGDFNTALQKILQERLSRPRLEDKDIVMLSPERFKEYKAEYPVSKIQTTVDIYVDTNKGGCETFKKHELQEKAYDELRKQARSRNCDIAEIVSEDCKQISDRNKNQTLLLVANLYIIPKTEK
ncbi:MAG: hypothetical protein V1725_03320 [archaeon]